MKTQIPLPRIIENFFVDCVAPKETPEGYVYFGCETENGFPLIPWHTKVKGGEYLKSEHISQSQNEKYYYVYISISEVISYVLGPNPYVSDFQKEDIRNYIKVTGLTLEDFPNIKNKSSTGVKRNKPLKKPKIEKPTEKLFEGEIIQTVKVWLKNSMNVYSCSNSKKEQIEVGPGEIILIEILSPLEHLEMKDRKKYTWGILKDHLPKIFGKPVHTWHQFLGFNPFRISEDHPPAQ
jgi:hypothetical protein